LRTACSTGGCDSLAIRARQILESVVDHLGHQIAGKVAVRRHAAFQILHEFGRAPAADTGFPVRGDIGNHPTLDAVAGAGKVVAIPKTPERITRGMTLAAVRSGLYQIRATVPLGIFLLRRHERAGREIQPLPSRQ
jgi:hypothetical protein